MKEIFDYKDLGDVELPETEAEQFNKMIKTAEEQIKNIKNFKKAFY